MQRQTPLSPDTSPAVAALQFALWRELSPRQKLDQVRSLTRTVLILERVGLRLLRPDLAESDTFRLLATRRLGEDLAARAFGPDLARR